MYALVAILIFTLLSFLAMGEQGTVSTDDNQTSQAPASLSGYEMPQNQEMREEEVQIIDDDYVEEDGKRIYDPEKVQEDENQWPPVNPDTKDR